MALRNFDTDLDVLGVSQIVRQTVEVSQSVEVVAHRSQSLSHIGKADESWTWDDLRDYVVFEIEERFGAISGRDARKEAGIFKSFMTRHGDKAVAIARVAFEQHDGYWAGSPVTLTRFCKNSDPYFADVIAERVHQTPAQAW